MPLAAYVEDRVARMRALLADPSVVGIEIATLPETELAAVKLLAAAADDEDEPNLLIGWSGTFENAEQFCRAIAKAVAAEVEVALEALDGELLAFRIPEGMRDEPKTAVDVRLIEYLEKLAAAFHNHVQRIVLALDVDAHDAAAWADMRARLLANTGSDRIVWATFGVQPSEARAVACHRQRTIVADVDAELVRLVDLPGARMATFVRGTASPNAVSVRLQRRTFAKLLGWVTVEIPPLSAITPLDFFAGCARTLARMFSRTPHIAPLLEEVEQQTFYAEAELSFADFCDRLVVATLKPGTGLVVVIHPPHEGDPVVYEAALDRLARAAASLKVKFVVFEPQASQPRSLATRRVEPIEIDFGPERIKAGIEADLKKPDLPQRERLQLTLALSGLRLGEEEPEQALELSVHALDLAQTSPEPVDACVAWYQHGNTLYHLCAFAPAEEAYAEAAHRALEHDQPGLAAMALTGAGHTFFCREDAERALKAYDAAKALFEKLGLLHHEIYVRTWMGQTCVMGQRYPDARDRFEEALKRCDAIDPLHADSLRGSKAEILHRMAYLYSLAGRPDLQRRYHEQAEALGMSEAPCMHP